jgi:hypothetical protein
MGIFEKIVRAVAVYTAATVLLIFSAFVVKGK